MLIGQQYISIRYLVLDGKPFISADSDQYSHDIQVWIAFISMTDNLQMTEMRRVEGTLENEDAVCLALAEEGKSVLKVDGSLPKVSTRYVGKPEKPC